MENNENTGSHKHATAKLVLDYVKVFIWPAVILFAIIIFKSQMENILENRKIKIGGLLEIGDRIEEIEKQATFEIEDVKKLTAELKKVQLNGSEDNVSEISRKITDKLEALDSNLSKSVGRLRKDASSFEQSAVSQQSIQQASIVKPIDKEGAKVLEAEGFKYITDRKINEAIRAFMEADELWPGYNNVGEIYKYLEHYEKILATADDTKKTELWSKLYETILLKYSWGMPKDIREELSKK